MSGLDPQRGEYPALAASLSPNSAVTVLNERIGNIAKTNRDIADWLQERRRVEEAYVQGLRKLSRREPPDATGDELGIFTASWQRIVGGVATLADSHHTFASRIENDVERQLRDFMAGNREVQQLSTITGNFASLARDHANAQKKVEKLRASNAATNKLSSATDDVDAALAQFESQSPFVFEHLQSVDVSRLDNLRNALTQMETHEVDKVEKNRATAESVLEALLNVNIADEITAFTAKNVGAERVASRPDSSQQQSQRHERRSSRFIPTLGSSQAPTNGEDSNEPEAFRDAGSVPSTPAADEKKPKGLRRLGTVFSRKNRQSVMGRPTPGRGKSATGQRLGSSTDLAEEPVAEEEEASAYRERSQEPPANRNVAQNLPQRGSSLRAPAPAPGDQAPQIAAAPQAAPLTLGAGLQEPLQPYQPPQPQHQSQQQATLQQLDPAGYSAPSAYQAPAANQAYQIPAPSQPYQQTTLQAPTSFEQNRYSAPPPSTSLDPIAQAQREAAESGDSTFESGNRPYTLDIRNAPISEEGADADAAMATVANTLRASAAPPAKRAGTVRGRRDVRNTVFVPTESASSSYDSYHPAAAASAPAPIVTGGSSIVPGAATTLSPTQGATASPITPVPIAAPLPAPSAATATAPPSSSHRQFGSEDHTSDNQSVRSGRSMASSAAGLGGSSASKHVDSTAPGLSSSIVETVSATLENGSITRCGVQGELALSYNPADGSNAIAPGARETIRLDNFAALEKVAPNPGFVDPRVPGEYAIDVQALALATGQPVHLAHGKPAVAFKYKLHGDAATLAATCPLLLTPSWKHEPSQTSAILTYTLNPSFASASAATLSNVFLVLHLTGARASSCQSKPAGTFSRRENLLYWRFEDLALSAASGPQKLIARFATDGLATGGRVEARWESVAPPNAPGALAVSRLAGAPGGSDPFADESGASAGAWSAVGGTRRLVSGSYVAT